MIHIKVEKENNQIKCVILKGHAAFADYGKDIVCAGVSSILTTTVNGILLIKDNAIVYRKEKDKFTISVQSKDEITQKLMQNMTSLFHELEETYPKNIKLESEE